MTAPLSSGVPGKTEYSHGRSRAAHPDSDYQSGANTPFATAQRAQGSKRGGFTQAMMQQAQLRLDATIPDEKVEDMLYALGNPDTGRPDEPIVQENRQIRPGNYAQPIRKYGVQRQK